MKYRFAVFFCCLLVLSCKKKESDPAPVQPDETIYTTGFDDGTWATHSSSKYTSVYDKEEFNLSIDTMNWFGYEIAPNNYFNSSYSIEADVKITIDDVNQVGYAGFIYNYVNYNNYSILNICTNGTFFAYQVVDGVGQQLIYSTISRALVKGSGQANNIKIKQRSGSQEYIFNGISQGLFPFKKDTRMVSAGLTVTTYKNYYTPTKASFDNFIIKKIY